MPLIPEVRPHCDACRELDHDACTGRFAKYHRESDTGYTYATACCCTTVDVIVNLDDTTAAQALIAAGLAPVPVAAAGLLSGVAADASSGPAKNDTNNNTERGAA